MMKITIDRQSVCMGDDVLPHKTDFDLPEHITVAGLIDFLKNNYYIPSVHGNNVAWELRNSGGEVAVYFTKSNLVSHATTQLRDIIDKTGDHFFVLVYHTTPEKYLEKRDK